MFFAESDEVIKNYTIVLNDLAFVISYCTEGVPEAYFYDSKTTGVIGRLTDDTRATLDVKIYLNLSVLSFSIGCTLESLLDTIRNHSV